MTTSATKCRRTSTEQASPRGACKNSRRIFASASPTSSSSKSPSPPRRRDALRNMFNVGRPRTPVAHYRGVRYREELNKYVTEIRPTRCSKKIWLGTYESAEEAARAFDIGNLCCNKNLPLNFPDSPSLLKRISSKLSPDEARSAIAKLAKEVAALFSINSTSNGDTREAPSGYSSGCSYESQEVLQLQAEAPRFQHELPQVQQLAAGGISPYTYIEQLEENVCSAMEEVATAMPIGESGPGSCSWSFDLSQVILGDELHGIPFLVDTPNVSPDHNHGDVYFYSHQ